MENDQTGNEAKAGQRLPRRQRALRGELEVDFFHRPTCLPLRRPRLLLRRECLLRACPWWLVGRCLWSDPRETHSGG